MTQNEMMQKAIRERIRRQATMMDFLGVFSAETIDKKLPDGYSCKYFKYSEDERFSDSLIIISDDDVKLAGITVISSEDRLPQLATMETIKTLDDDELIKLDLILIALSAELGIPLAQRLKF